VEGDRASTDLKKEDKEKKKKEETQHTIVAGTGTAAHIGLPSTLHSLSLSESPSPADFLGPPVPISDQQTQNQTYSKLIEAIQYTISEKVPVAKLCSRSKDGGLRNLHSYVRKLTS